VTASVTQVSFVAGILVLEDANPARLGMSFTPGHVF
jgi:hypothetical protein